MAEAIAGGPLFVAALAVAATIVTTVMTGRSQRGLAREQYLIKQRTRTYVDIVAATGKYEGGIDQALYRISGRLSARMEVYASHKAWTKYVVASGMYEKLMKTNDPRTASYFEVLEAAKDTLISQIRHDLGTPGPFILSHAERLTDEEAAALIPPELPAD
jgi:hypothetical protein